MNLRSLSLKTALLLALASVKRVGDLQALSISPACLEFGPNDSKVVLKPRHGYVPKVLSTPFRAQVITLSALPPSEEDRELSLLCPVRALRIYFERSAPFRRTEQLFVSFGNRAKGHPVTKQRLSKWIVDAVMLAYSSLGLQCPLEYEPIRLEASPRHGRGLAVCPLQRFVRWLAGPLRPHLLGFITWTYRPYRPESSLLRWAYIHTLWEQSCQRFLDRNALRLSDWHPAYSG